MKVLGIDPGTSRLGYGVIEEIGQTYKAVEFGCFTPKAKNQGTAKNIQDEAQQLLEIFEFLRELIRKQKPASLAIEKLFFNKNVTTALSVGQASGVVKLAAALGDVPIFTYTPLEIKMALTGYGRAEKGQIQQMTKVLLKLDKIPKIDDTADALAVAICHLQSRSFWHKVEKAK